MAVGRAHTVGISDQAYVKKNKKRQADIQLDVLSKVRDQTNNKRVRLDASASKVKVQAGPANEPDSDSDNKEESGSGSDYTENAVPVHRAPETKKIVSKDLFAMRALVKQEPIVIEWS